jgi:hypothetical protein
LVWCGRLGPVPASEDAGASSHCHCVHAALFTFNQEVGEAEAETGRHRGEQNGRPLSWTQWRWFLTPDLRGKEKGRDTPPRALKEGEACPGLLALPWPCPAQLLSALCCAPCCVVLAPGPPPGQTLPSPPTTVPSSTSTTFLFPTSVQRPSPFPRI